MEILQSHFVGNDPATHVSWLLKQLAPVQGARVIDMGCGTGAVSKRMSELRPDLKFTLVNKDVDQLSLCPTGDAFELLHGDYLDTNLPAGCADAVMFCFSLWYTSPEFAMGEAARLLRPGGRLLVYETTGGESVDAAFKEQFGFGVHTAESVAGWATKAGFVSLNTEYPATGTDMCRTWLASVGEAHLFDKVFAPSTPFALTGSRAAAKRTTIEDVLARHTKVALQLSGGKDSVTTLWLLRPYLDRITVYWVNAGDAAPETHRVIDECRNVAPNFVEIKTDSLTWRKIYGDPTDLFPTFCSPTGRLLGFGKNKYSDRLTCCRANVMAPLHRRMLADGVTCVIRGQKSCDMPAIPFQSGESIGNMEFFYPIEDWTHQDVLDFLRTSGAPVHKVYEYGTCGFDCMHCTGGWNEALQRFRKAEYPEAYQYVKQKLEQIGQDVRKHLTALDSELES